MLNLTDYDVPAQRDVLIDHLARQRVYPNDLAIETVRLIHHVSIFPLYCISIYEPDCAIVCLAGCYSSGIEEVPLVPNHPPQSRELSVDHSQVEFVQWLQCFLAVRRLDACPRGNNLRAQLLLVRVDGVVKTACLAMGAPVVPEPVEVLLFGGQDLRLKAHVFSKQLMEKIWTGVDHALKDWSLPVLDPEWWPVLLDRPLDPVLARVGQKVARDDQGYIGSLSIRPREEASNLVRWHTALIVLAVDEPRFQVNAAIKIVRHLALANNVASGIRRA